VRWNLVSPEAAERAYGVVLDESGRVDASATESKREELRSGRRKVPEFDHGPLPPLEEQQRVIAETRRKFNEWLSHELGGTNRG
jgi:N-methylhydantoinase B